MFGVGIIGGGDIYVALLVFCLSLSIWMKLSVALARRYGWRDWTVPMIRILWPVVTVVIFVLAILLIAALAWLRPANVLAQAISALTLVAGVGAVLYMLAIERQRWHEIDLTRIGAIAALSFISMGLAAGFCALFFRAHYIALISMVVLILFSRRFNHQILETT